MLRKYRGVIFTILYGVILKSSFEVVSTKNVTISNDHYPPNGDEYINSYEIHSRLTSPIKRHAIYPGTVISAEYFESAIYNAEYTNFKEKRSRNNNVTTTSELLMFVSSKFTQESVMCDMAAALSTSSTSAISASWTCSDQTPTLRLCSAVSSPWIGVTCSGINGVVSRISLEKLSLTGSIPSSIGELTSLTYLNLNTNSLQGSIPSSIGLLTNLQTIDVSFNRFTGTIPSSLGDMSSMMTLTISFNSLKGSIPSELSKLTAMYSMKLLFNSLTGTIPSSLASMASLVVLLLDSNSLTGTIPSSFGQMSSLSILRLLSNNLQGSIPSSLCAINANPGIPKIFTYSNPQLTCYASCLSTKTAVTFGVSMSICVDPTTKPSTSPTTSPPTTGPSMPQTIHPSTPSSFPTLRPSMPSYSPTSMPSQIPTTTPRPSKQPSSSSSSPSAAPTRQPSAPSSKPTRRPSTPSAKPTTKPSIAPTRRPSTPSRAPTVQPSAPSATPSRKPSVVPTRLPSAPTSMPSILPSRAPTRRPSAPSVKPSRMPSRRPSKRPNRPTSPPTTAPNAPSRAPVIRFPTYRPNASLVQAGIQYHGGDVMLGQINVYVIWYGDWSGAKGTGSDAGTQTIITDFISNLGGSSWWNIGTSYTKGSGARCSNLLKYVGSISVPGSGPISFSLNLDIIVDSLISGKLPYDTSGIYLIIPSQDITDPGNFGAAGCTSSCGYHTATGMAKGNMKWAFITNPYSCPGGAGCILYGENTANNNAAADAMVSVIAHELTEAQTSPLLTAWYSDIDGYENADKCAWNFGKMFVGKNGYLNSNMYLGSRSYLIQQNWLNVGSGSCVTSFP